MTVVKNIGKLKSLITGCQQAAAGGDARAAETLPYLLVIQNLAEYAQENTWLSANEEVMEFQSDPDAIEMFRAVLMDLDMFPLSPFEEEAGEG